MKTRITSNKIELRSEKGGTVSLEREDDGSPYLQWQQPHGYLFGVANNNADTRKFLREALHVLEQDHTKSLVKSLKKPKPWVKGGDTRSAVARASRFDGT